MIMNRGFNVIALHKCVGGGRLTFIRPNTKQAALVSSQICFPTLCQQSGMRETEEGTARTQTILLV